MQVANVAVCDRRAELHFDREYTPVRTLYHQVDFVTTGDRLQMVSDWPYASLQRVPAELYYTNLSDRDIPF
jgi:hypothetical protein